MQTSISEAHRRALRRACASACVVLVSGCASFSPDGGFESVATTARQQLGKEVIWSRTPADQDAAAKRVADLLARPLTPDDAVQVALLNNRGLQAAFAELAISEAELVKAGRLPNPRFSMLRARGSGPAGAQYNIEQAVTLNVLALVAMPQVSAIERRRFEQTQRQASLHVLRLSWATRKAYYSAVASAESLRYARQVQQAAQAGAELARRMQQAGNFNALQQAREQGFHAEASLGLARAEQAATESRERLMRLLGLSGGPMHYTLPERLPDLPRAPQNPGELEQRAMDQRLDVQAARLQSEALAKNLGLSKATRFINVLEFGPARVLEGAADAGHRSGYEVSLELPLFDWGTAKVAQAEALYLQSVHVAAQTAIEARSEVRQAYQRYRSDYDIALRYRNEIVPLHQRISQENLLRYNGMLIGVFDLLADARAQIASVNGSIQALRDFWMAQADLDLALMGKPLPARMQGTSDTTAGQAIEGDQP